MKALLVLAAVATLTVGTAACAQTSGQAVLTDQGTPPTLPGSGDTRMQDQGTAVSPSTNNGTSQSEANDLGYGNWRTSNGFNSDQSNPSGAPGPSTITSGGH
jgi:opacity protein-like surface antigen